MPLTSDQAVAEATRLRNLQNGEREKLDDARRYWTGRQRLPAIIPRSAPPEVREMARMARVNVIAIVVEALAQSLFVEGFRGLRESDNHEVWDGWQANRMDKRQGGVYRATLAYGAAYGSVWPGRMADGRRMPVIRGSSPRLMTTEYGDDPDWPVHALERRRSGFRLYDEEALYRFRVNGNRELEHVDTTPHDFGVTPVVRFMDAEDLDAEDDAEDLSIVGGVLRGSGERLVAGEVGPLMSLQDQVDLTTFNLLVTQHYSAFKQRYVLGWVAEDEKQQLEAAASQLWTFPDHPSDISVGELSESNLGGYIDSRKEALKYAATLSQTPVHELIGELVNLSAAALAAVEAGRDRRVDDRKTILGESNEQVFGLVGQVMGVEIPDNAQVIWRDTSAREFNAIVQGLGILARELGVPQQELWERVPGVSQQDVERWRAAAAEGDAFARLTATLDRQANEPEADPDGQDG